jgi:recombination protein RecA
MPPKAEKTVVAEKPAPEAAKIAATRARELEAAISSITKTYGDGSIMRLGTAVAQKKIQVIPTGSLALDLALGSAAFRADV